MKEYIDKEAFVAELKDRQDAAKAWLREAKNQETRVRADAVLHFIREVKLTLEKITLAVSTDGDSVSRKAVIDLAMQYCPDDDGSCSRADVDIREMLDELEALPAVPQEMSAREFAKAFRRMCDSYDVNGHNSCEGCEVWRENICCLWDLPDIIPIVEKWAKEHLATDMNVVGKDTNVPNKERSEE